MRDKLGLALAASLLFVGAGCAGTGNVDMSGGNRPPSGSEGTQATLNIDADVSSIINGADAETSASLNTESDASEVNSDGSGVDAMVNGSYDVK